MNTIYYECPVAAKAHKKLPFHLPFYKLRTKKRTRIYACILCPWRSRQLKALGDHFLPVWVECAQRHCRESQPVGVEVEVEVDRVAEVVPVDESKLPVQ